MQKNQQPTLEEVARDMRGVFERMLAQSIGTTKTAGSCFYASLLLLNTIQRFCDAQARMRGGDGLLDGGYVDALGRSHGHYWIEARNADGQAWVVDITSDQFGGPDLLVEPLQNTVHQYRPGDQKTVDEHVQNFGVME